LTPLVIADLIRNLMRSVFRPMTKYGNGKIPVGSHPTPLFRKGEFGLASSGYVLTQKQ
jgi:hypothetical protein